jgi:two-component system response regulator GlrR
MMTDKHAPAATRVLIVEDDVVFRVPLRATLAAEGYAVVAVESAEAAEAVLAREDVDVVLSDLRLPGLDGATLAARHPRIPFVVMRARHRPTMPLRRRGRPR